MKTFLLDKIAGKALNFISAHKELPKLKKEILSLKDTIEERKNEIWQYVKREQDLAKEVKAHQQQEEKLNAEVKKWKDKFDKMWSTWNKLAIEAKGEVEAKKMADKLKKGQI